MEEVTDTIKRIPSYDNQVSIYEKDTFRNVEEFRAARSNWLAETAMKTTQIKENVRLNETNIYNGRCRCLRRMRLKTTGLRVHFRTLRPKMLFTLRQKVTSLEALEEKEKKKLELEKCLRDKEWSKAFYKDFHGSEVEVEKKGQGKPKKKIKEVPYRQVKSPGPCEKAKKKLRAAKFQSKMIESCKCDDGREVTVIIKGFCLCDKTSLNQIKLDRVRDEYSKFLTVPEEVNFPNRKNSLELYRKKLSQRTQSSLQEDQEVRSDLSDGKISKKNSVELKENNSVQKSLKSIKEEEEMTPYENDTERTERLESSEETRRPEGHSDQFKPGTGEDQVKSEAELKSLNIKKSEEFVEKKDFFGREKEVQNPLSVVILKSNATESIQSEPEFFVKSSKGFKIEEDIIKAEEDKKKDNLIVIKPSSMTLHTSELQLQVERSKEFKKEELILTVENKVEEKSKIKVLEQTAAEQQQKDEPKLEETENRLFKEKDKQDESSVTILKQASYESKEEPKLHGSENNKNKESSVTEINSEGDFQSKDERTLSETDVNKLIKEDKREKDSVLTLKSTTAESPADESRKRANDEIEKTAEEISSGENKPQSQMTVMLPKAAVMLPKVESEFEEKQSLSFSDQSHVDDPSLLSLYRNLPEEQSTFALTKEQFDKLKENSSGYEILKDKIIL